MSYEHEHSQQKVTQNNIDFLKIPEWPNVCQMKDVSKTSHHDVPFPQAGREKLALLPDARPANSIQVGSFKLCTTTWHNEMIRKGHD